MALVLAINIFPQGKSLLCLSLYNESINSELKIFNGISMTETAKMNLDHVRAFEKEREAAGIKTDVVSPKILPVYHHGNKEFEKEIPGASK